ncbi:MAG: hypothetical protein V5A59_14040 [Bacteroidales bacterium]
MSKDGDNDTNEPLSDYGQPLTFEKVWQMFQETDKMFQETRKQLEESRRQFQESREQFQETRRQFQEVREQSKETDRRIDKLARLYGGVSSNSRDVAEEFFRRGLETRDSLFGISYDQLARLKKKTRKLQGEFDIVLYNGDYMIVIEVKYKLHPDDVEDFLNRKLPAFKPLFPEYADKKLIGAVAAMSVPTDSYDLAEKNGLLVLTQSGENISVMNPKDFVLKEY